MHKDEKWDAILVIVSEWIDRLLVSGTGAFEGVENEVDKRMKRELIELLEANGYDEHDLQSIYDAIAVRDLKRMAELESTVTVH